jgi:parallel beta-helix repeat protein
MNRALAPILLAVVLAGCSSSSTTPAAPAPSPCDGIAGTCVGITAGMAESEIQAKLATIADHTTVAFAAGTFHFQNALAFNANFLTLQGAGMTNTILDFGAQATGGAGGEGISSTGHDFYLHDLAVKDPAGNGVKMSHANNQHVNRLHVSWSTDGAKSNGPYGIYPVACTNVLIENSYSRGASDTGFYVGQSTNIEVRNNEAEDNVMGVEVENCHGANVHDNYLHGNTGGVLVFTGPNLAQKDGNTTHVHHNNVIANNHPNFGYGGMVTQIPAGSGVVVMANRDVEVDNNTITGNDSVAVAAISFIFTGLAQTTAPDPAYYPYEKRIYVHDNTFSGNGTAPDTSRDLGTVLWALTFDPRFPTVPDVIYDGVLDPDVVAAPPSGAPAGNPMEVCLGAGTPPSFANLTQDQNCAVVSGTITGPCLPLTASTDALPYACTLPALPAITVSL